MQGKITFSNILQIRNPRAARGGACDLHASGVQIHNPRAGTLNQVAKK